MKHTARIATVANHLEDARSAKLRILFQSLADEGQVGIGQAAAQRLSAIEAVRFNRVANSIRMDLKFTGNRPDLPVFAKEQMTNLLLEIKTFRDKDPLLWGQYAEFNAIEAKAQKIVGTK